MNEVNELWSSPWLKLQKALASGFGIDGPCRDIPAWEPPSPVRIVSSNSWLVRARSREVQVSRFIQ